MARAASAKPARGKGSMLWVQGLACGALLTFATPSVLMVAVLLAPALLCLLGDRDAAQAAPRAVALCCAAAALRPLWYLWMQGDRMDDALAALSQPLTLVLAWGAGACAWALCQVAPVVLRAGWDAREAARGRQIEAELARLRAEWEFGEI